MRLRGCLLFACFCHVLVPAGDAPPLKRGWVHSFEVSRFYREQLEGKMGDERLAVLKSGQNAVNDITRLAIALACDPSIAEDERVLRDLLNDTAPYVRCAAARALLGAAAEEAATARNHRYGDVLKAELNARAIFDGLLKLNGRQQHAATLKLIALGPDALLEIRRHYTDENARVVLTALSAWISICDKRAAIPPQWHADVTKKLSKEISVEFTNFEFKEAVSFLSALTGVKMRVQENTLPLPLTLRMHNTPGESVLNWIAKQAFVEYRLAPGEVIFVQSSVVCGWSMQEWLLDARDLVEICGEEAVLKVLPKDSLSRSELVSGFVIGLFDQAAREAHTQALQDLRAKQIWEFPVR